MLRGKLKPSHSLGRVQELVAAGSYRLVLRAFEDAAALGFDSEHVVDCICSLEPTDFDRSIRSKLDRHEWLDVYLTEWDATFLYLKLIRREMFSRSDRENVIVLSFHEDEGAWHDR